MTTLARLSRSTKQNISMIDRGFVEPKVSTLAKLATALDASVSEFFVEKAS